MGLKAQDVYAILNSRIEEGGSGGELETVKQTVNEMQEELNTFQSEVEGKYLYVGDDLLVKNTNVPLMVNVPKEGFNVKYGASADDTTGFNGIYMEHEENKIFAGSILDFNSSVLYLGAVIEGTEVKQSGAIGSTSVLFTSGEYGSDNYWTGDLRFYDDGEIPAMAIAINGHEALFSVIQPDSPHPEESGYITISGVGRPVEDRQVANKIYVDEAVAGVDLSGYLPLSGGALTGPLTLSGDPTSNNHAATKNYVDDEITEMHDYLYDEFLDITGGTMEGDIDMNNGEISSIYTLSFNHYSSLSGENSGRPLTAFSGWKDSNERNYIMTYKDMAFVDETMDSGSRKNALGFIHYENTEYGGTFRIGFGTRYDQSLGHIIAARPEAPGHVAIKSYVDFYANTFIDEVSISNANFNILEPRVGEDWDMLTVKKILDGETNPNSDYYGLGYIQGSDSNKYLSAIHVNKPYSTASTQTATYELAELKVATPTTDDSAVNKEYVDENYVNKSDMDTEQEKLEKMIENYYAMRRTGKVYQTKLWKYNTNPSSTGEKLLDNAELVFEPSTDTTEGQDDYLNGQHPMFEWLNVNYVRDEDGTARPTAIEGTDSYKTSGTVDVGVMQMSFYWRWDTSNAEYDLITVSDSPHPELGLEPWPECVKEDGTVLPWCIGSKYISGIASDGLLRSQPNLKPERKQSHNNMITNYQLKGTGYWGAGAVRNLFQIVFNAIKGATKSSQTLYQGVTSYSFQYEASVQRSENETYFPVTNAQAANIIVGNCVSVGYGHNVNGEINTDRYYDELHTYVDDAKVISVETLDENNKAVYLDIETGFNTTPVQLTEELTAPIVMSSMYTWSGMTDNVLGKHDGSPVSNTNSKYPYRVQGREYAVGGYIVASDSVIDLQSDYTKKVYVAEKGTAHSSSDSTIRSTYKEVGTIPASSAGNNADWWIGDVAVDMSTGAWYPSVEGSSNAQGVGDRCYAGGATATSGTREYLQGGHLGDGSGAGSACLYCWSWLGSGDWLFLGCD